MTIHVLCLGIILIPSPWGGTSTFVDLNIAPLLDCVQYECSHQVTFSSFLSLYLPSQHLFSSLISFRMINKFTLTSYKIKVTVQFVASVCEHNNKIWFPQKGEGNLFII
jgi:hypothetical protein